MSFVSYHEEKYFFMSRFEFCDDAKLPLQNTRIVVISGNFRMTSNLSIEIYFYEFEAAFNSYREFLK